MFNDFLFNSCKEYIDSATISCIQNQKGMLIAILMLAYGIIVLSSIKDDKYKFLSISILAGIIGVICIIYITKI